MKEHGTHAEHLNIMNVEANFSFIAEYLRNKQRKSVKKASISVLLSTHLLY